MRLLETQSKTLERLESLILADKSLGKSILSSSNPETQVQFSISPVNRDEAILGYRGINNASEDKTAMLKDLDFPVFDGKHPYIWINRVERFFRSGNYSDTDRLGLVHVGLKGVDLDWYAVEVKKEPFVDWDHFTRRWDARSRSVKRQSPPHVHSKNDSISELVQDAESVCVEDSSSETQSLVTKADELQLEVLHQNCVKKNFSVYGEFVADYRKSEAICAHESAEKGEMNDLVQEHKSQVETVSNLEIDCALKPRKSSSWEHVQEVSWSGVKESVNRALSHSDNNSDVLLREIDSRSSKATHRRPKKKQRKFLKSWQFKFKSMLTGHITVLLITVLPYWNMIMSRVQQRKVDFRELKTMLNYSRSLEEVASDDVLSFGSYRTSKVRKDRELIRIHIKSKQRNYPNSWKFKYKIRVVSVNIVRDLHYAGQEKVRHKSIVKSRWLLYDKGGVLDANFGMQDMIELLLQRHTIWYTPPMLYWQRKLLNKSEGVADLEGVLKGKDTWEIHMVDFYKLYEHDSIGRLMLSLTKEGYVFSVHHSPSTCDMCEKTKNDRLKVVGVLCLWEFRIKNWKQDRFILTVGFSTKYSGNKCLIDSSLMIDSKKNLSRLNVDGVIGLWKCSVKTEARRYKNPDLGEFLKEFDRQEHEADAGPETQELVAGKQRDKKDCCNTMVQQYVRMKQSDTFFQAFYTSDHTTKKKKQQTDEWFFNRNYCKKCMDRFKKRTHDYAVDLTRVIEFDTNLQDRVVECTQRVVQQFKKEDSLKLQVHKDWCFKYRVKTWKRTGIQLEWTSESEKLQIVSAIELFRLVYHQYSTTHEEWRFTRVSGDADGDADVAVREVKQEAGTYQERLRHKNTVVVELSTKLNVYKPGISYIRCKFADICYCQLVQYQLQRVHEIWHRRRRKVFKAAENLVICYSRNGD